MRDERVAPKGWPKDQRSRRSGKVGRWHDDWVDRSKKLAKFRSQGRRAGSDYNLHHVDIEAPLGAIMDFDRRVREIDGRDPDRGRHLPEPDTFERTQGALFGAVIGDAFGRAVDSGATVELPWSPDLNLRGDKALTEYVLPEGSTFGPSAVGQQLAFTLEGVIRSYLAFRTKKEFGTAPSAMQHAYQRWLYTQPASDGQRRRWQDCGGPYASGPEPDGWLVGIEGLYRDGAPNPGTVATLEEFARTGRRASLNDMCGRARGSDVVARAAAVAISVAEPAAAFEAAVMTAVLTHSSADDYLAAGTLAVILHQQIRDVPFYDCLTAAREQLEGWRGNKRMLRKIELALAMIRNHWTPTDRERIRPPFGNGGDDGAEALGLALYCAMASDYVREALLLAMNYSAHRPAVGAITGMLIGAECGVRTIPPDLQAAVPFTETIDVLVRDVLVERTTEPTDQEWLRRYPAW
ncbi:hypothetical protein GCM10011581_32040 [Saccharopolyspora subtropica]|uniref:ADP-ribosylglycohydrolase n=1 Tax=Saccharopolyspora thermophila TaxID=89367 RepID=A0A917K1B0_9PSEU|nr:ADP-ribosylglycohydrolase family protein [Saccharopolyspora subtropica]GGI92469.1 hypothetical protein GCM10011581_32040 [Saccharopolyspora subtropica]